MSEAGAQRAARHDSNFLPQGARSMVLDPWRATLKASGRDPDTYRVGIIRSCLVTDDRERDWPAVRAAERYRGEVYRSFNKDESAAGGVAGNTREASIPQTWVVGNVEHCVKELTSFVREYGITDLVTWAVPPGMRPETDERQSRTLRARRGAPRQSRGGLGRKERRRMGVGIGLGCAEFPFSGATAYWRWIDMCEAGGVDSIWQTDRIVGRQPFLESMTTMAALAGRTRRMRFGMNVVSLAFRDPVLLAKAVRHHRHAVRRPFAARLLASAARWRRNGRRSASIPGRAVARPTSASISSAACGGRSRSTSAAPSTS